MILTYCHDPNENTPIVNNAILDNGLIFLLPVIDLIDSFIDGSKHHLTRIVLVY